MTHFLAALGAIWPVLVVALVMLIVACWSAGVMDRNNRRRKAARRAEVEQQLADVEWLMIVTAVDGLAMHPAIVGHIARQAAASIDDEWSLLGGGAA